MGTQQNRERERDDEEEEEAEEEKKQARETLKWQRKSEQRGMFEREQT